MSSKPAAVGFSFKLAGKAKPQRKAINIRAAEEPDDDKIVKRVHGIDATGIETEADPVEPPLVIPLPSARATEPRTNGAATGTDELESKAIAALLSGESSTNKAKEASLVIDMAPEDQTAGETGVVALSDVNEYGFVAVKDDEDESVQGLRLKLFANAQKRKEELSKHEKIQLPVLMRGAMFKEQQRAAEAQAAAAETTGPSLAHASDMDVHDDGYNRVPIDKFGEAMLRGMGYTGADETGSMPYVPPVRQGGMGLGAADNDLKHMRKEKKYIKPGEVRTTVRAPVSRKFPGIKDGAVIRVGLGRHTGKIGIVTQSEGVPGLERAMCRLKGEPSIAFAKSSLRVVSAEALTAEDTAVLEVLHAEEAAVRAEERRKEKARAEKAARELRETERGAEKERRRKKDQEKKEKEKEGSEKRKRSSDDRRDDKAAKRQASSSSSSSRQDKERRRPPAWLLPGIRVRMVSKKGRYERYYKQKGIVSDVITPVMCDVRLDSGKLVSEVKDSALESVVPKAGGMVLVLRGEYRQERAQVLEKNMRKETAQLRLVESSEIVTLGLDDIAETA